MTCATHFAQTINFKGCVPLFEDQFFTFNETVTDTSGKKIYITTPVTGDQPCGGLGACEFKLQWNDTTSQWEFLADTGNGDFVDPYLIYYSTTANTSALNPPNIVIGNWVENTAVTNGDCGGNLTTANGTMTGDVRTTVLAVDQNEVSKITVYPNPATEFISIVGIDAVQVLHIISAEGKLISSQKFADKINISNLTSGIYFIEIVTDKTVIKRLKFIKN